MTTNDYSQFHFAIENREIDPFNLEKIKTSIKKHGVIPGRPILINKDGFIVDGQHRYLALKELGMPIEYEVLSGETASKTIDLNACQKPWLLIDFARSYAAQGNDQYRKLLKFDEKYQLGFSSSISVFTNHNLRHGQVKLGNPFKIWEKAEKVGDFIENLDSVHFKKTKPFVNALVTLFNKADDEQILMVKNHILKVPKFNSAADYRLAFENIINYKKKQNFFKL